MNLQSITIIFIIIFLPIMLISTFYIQQEITTIALQSSYDTKLIDATSDALTAFEINTANEDLSGVSDYLRNIIEASNNVFINTLATNLGLSNANKSRIVSYVPAIVYTLYDGYYIYSPTQQPIVVTDEVGKYVKVGDDEVIKSGTGKYTYMPGSGLSGTVNNNSEYGKMLYYTNLNNTNGGECTIDPNQAAYKTEYILKSYMPYSMRYTNSIGNKYDITINYTLDNFITVEGTYEENYGEVYYTKSGYLIDNSIMSTMSFGGFDINSIALDKLDMEIEKSGSTSVTVNGITISSDDKCAYSNRYDFDPSTDMANKYFSLDGKFNDNVSAIQYYAKAYKFSKWFYDRFGELNENQMESSYTDNSEFHVKTKLTNDREQKNIFYDFSANKRIFKDNTGNFENPESNDSYFKEHKRRIIQNSIQYNLNLAMAVYNAGQGDAYYQMPMLTEPEWDKVLSNVSIIAFMQGLPCGMKTYNNYAIVTSNNNELLANIDDIYYVPVNNFSDFVYTENGSDKIESFGKINWDSRDNNYINYLKTYTSSLGFFACNGEIRSMVESKKELF